MTTEQETEMAERVILALLPPDHPDNQLLTWMRHIRDGSGIVYHKTPPRWLVTLKCRTDMDGALEMMKSLEKRGLVARHPQKGWFLK